MALVSAEGLQAVAVTSFVGRRAELSEIRRGLSASRMLTLTGVGGVGKTRLAMRAAWELRRSFPDGVYWAELASLDDGRLLPQTVATAMAIRDSFTAWTADTLADRLRERRVLLVLDNFEHLLDSCAELVATLLTRCPGLRILGTSREPLRIQGERVLPVQALGVPPGDMRCPVQELRRFEAIRLFEDRAAAAIPHFEVDDRNGPAVARLCRRLDGIPLAVELAAASLRVLSPDELLRRLDDRFRVLISGNRAALPRHQTLRASIDWSFGLCTEHERALWARMSIFPGSCDVAAVEAVCADAALPHGEILTALTGLVEKSVVIRDARETGVCYRLLETIRQYGREVLHTTGQEQELRKRHRDWYVKIAEETRRKWFGPAQLDLVQQARLNDANVRAALDFCLAVSDESHQGLRLADAYRDLWRVGGLTSEGRRWFARLLDNDVEPSVPRIRALASASYLALMQNDLATATDSLEESRKLAADFGQEQSATLYQVCEAVAAMQKNDFPKAIVLLEEFVARHQDTEELDWLASALLNLGICHSVLSDGERAMANWTKMLDLCVHHGETWRRTWALWGLGFAAWREGDWDRAEAFELQCMDAQRVFDDTTCAANCLETMSWIAASSERSEQAAQLAGAAHTLRRDRSGPLSQFPFLSEYQDRTQAQVRQSLGEKRYARAFKKGTHLTFDQVATQLLGEPAARTKSDREATAEDLLTKREQEVANLVAQGMSNKQIAETLVISQRTAETHVEHILTKLGFTSRSQIAALVAQGKK
ncbi:LuxR C-terminal-related transcriptional regulator [Saccharopolyspora pogona]|uniref:LuxR C-terminal-related transcriptional regulator n=1 Tax=Saccharopolyspora pogona TaxID=333966 RepID=UPI0021E0FA65|nr:LuxR C-terminal-related transcriptional regulator [Saccharopolyspora pogona]